MGRLCTAQILQHLGISWKRVQADRVRIQSQKMRDKKNFIENIGLCRAIIVLNSWYISLKKFDQLIWDLLRLTETVDWTKYFYILLLIRMTKSRQSNIITKTRKSVCMNSRSAIRKIKKPPSVHEKTENTQNSSSLLRYWTKETFSGSSWGEGKRTTIAEWIRHVK